MKTIRDDLAPARLLLRTGLVLLATLPARPLPAATGQAAPAPAPKTHTLFMGANLTIFAKDGASYPVRDVYNHAFVAFNGDQRIVASGESNDFRLKIDDTLKMATATAEVGKLNFERSYTPEHDPMTRYTAAVRVANYAAGNIDTANSELADGEALRNMAQAGLSKLPAGAPAEASASWLRMKADGEAMMQRAEEAGRQALTLSNQQVFSTVGNSTTMTNEYGAELYDAITVTFDLSSPRPLNQPYVVVFMRYFDSKDHHDSASTWIYAERVYDISEHPRKITIRRGGFPPGYEIDSYHVHLYDGGTEIATNVARKRVELTSDEAFDYSVIEYIGSNRNQTRAPTKARAFWPSDLHTRLLPEKLTQTLWVKVRKDGRATSIYEDADCSRPVADATLAAVAPELRFLPALEKGKPVEGIAAIKLGPRG